MSGPVPSDEQLARIERGVHRRIDRRRNVARGVAGGAAGLAIVLGGFALLPGLVSGSGSASSASGGSAMRDSAADEGVTVVCEGADPTVVRVDPAGLPESATSACIPVTSRGEAFSSGGSAVPSAASSDATDVWTGALCRAEDDSLHVYEGTAGVCEDHGMTVVTEP